MSSGAKRRAGSTRRLIYRPRPRSSRPCEPRDTLGAGSGRELGLDEAADLASLQSRYVDAKIGTEMETYVVLLEQAVRNRDIRPTSDVVVEGGLPLLPGTRIDMPPRTLTATATDPDEGGSS
jgi:hypothetical protein